MRWVRAVVRWLAAGAEPRGVYLITGVADRPPAPERVEVDRR